MRTKKAIIGLLIHKSVEDGNLILDYVSAKGKGMIESIQIEVFPRIQFPPLDLFLKAYQFSQEYDIESELEQSFIADDNRDSRRRRRYRRLYRIYSVLRDFAVIDQVGKPIVVIPFPNENIPGKLLMFDQEGKVW